MNDVIKIILKRRSIRAFKPDKPEAVSLNKILECAAYAPSGMNTQNWHFSLVKNRKLIERLNKDVCGILPKDALERLRTRAGGGDISVFYNAPVIIMVSSPVNDAGALINAGLATQNICLAAESLCLNTCIVGLAALLFNEPQGEQYLKELCIPDGYKPVHAVCIGYRDMNATAPERAEGKISVIE